MINCEFENGNKANLRHVVVDVIVIEKDKVLLVKRANHLESGGKYGLIGGYVDRDETIRDAVLREVEEETGYKVEIIRQLRVIDSPNRPGENRQNVAFLFLAKPIKKVSEPDDESTEVKWFPLDKLPDKKDFAFDHYENIAWFRGVKND